MPIFVGNAHGKTSRFALKTSFSLAIDSNTDILVIGGGMSGFAAAMAAATDGAKVMVVDKNPIVGGNATNANVGTICGAYYRTTVQKPTAVGYDFCKTLYNKVLQIQGLNTPIKYHNGLWVIPYNWKQLQSLINSELTIAGVNYLPHTEVTAITVDGNKITTLRIAGAGNEHTISPKAIVDCSGNAVISRLAGLPTLASAQYQAASQVFRIGGVAATNEFALDMSLKRSVSKILKQHADLPNCFNSISVLPGSLQRGFADIKIVLPNIITDEIELAAHITSQANAWVNQIFSLLKANTDAFSGAHLDIIYPSPGIRTQQRAKGKYVLLEDDVIGCRKTDDEIATGVWPIEEWGSNGAVKLDYFAENDSYSVPAGCLQSPELNNLFFAGKNISATTRAIGSARVIGTCLQTGFAAGKLATCENDQQRTKTIIDLKNELRVDACNTYC